MARQFRFDPPQRVLLGPGPSIVPARVLSALARPTVGYMDPTYLGLMERLQEQLRWLFQTENRTTFAVTGSGSAAMECAIMNLVEPGERALCCVHGFFGERMRLMLERAGAQVTVVEAPWGEPIDPAAVDQAMSDISGASLLTVVHGETSTGVVQDVRELARIARRHGALLLVDTVASLGSVPFLTDEWGVDAVYTGSQKCLSAPPGISPVTFGPHAIGKIRKRKAPVNSWNLDVGLILKYWERPAAYHHTGPINLTYALHEALNLLAEEGLASRAARTEITARALWAGLEAMGLKLVVAAPHRLTTLTTVRSPEGVDEARVRKRLLEEFDIEIAGGLGSLAGKAWRVGLMGASCEFRHVVLLLSALEQLLVEEGVRLERGAAVSAASARFELTDQIASGV